MKKIAGIFLVLLLIITALSGCWQKSEKTEIIISYTPVYRFGSEANNGVVKKREAINAKIVPYDGGYYFVNETVPENGEVKTELYYITDSGTYNKVDIVGNFQEFLSGKDGTLYACTSSYDTGKSTDIIYKLDITAAYEDERGSQYHFIYEDDAKYSYKEGGNTVFRSEFGSGAKEEIFSFGYDPDVDKYVNHGENAGFQICALQKYDSSFYFIFAFGKQEKYFARYETKSGNIKVYDSIENIYGYKIDSGYIYYAVLTGGGNADLMRVQVENDFSETVASGVYGTNFSFGEGCIYYSKKCDSADGTEHFQICRKDNDLSERVIYEADSSGYVTVEIHDNRLFVVKEKISEISDNRRAREVYELSDDGEIIAVIANSDDC